MSDGEHAFPYANTTNVVIAAPDPDWVPLRLGPFYFQHGFDLDQWYDLDPNITMMDFDAAFPGTLLFDAEEGVFLVKPTSGHRFLEIDPNSTVAEMVPALTSGTGADAAASVHAAEEIKTAWQTLKTWFENAVTVGSCAIVARVQHAWGDFAVLPLDVWRSFDVIDRDRGIARSPAGEFLFSIHAAKLGTSIAPQPVDHDSVNQLISGMSRKLGQINALRWQLRQHLSGVLKDSLVSQHQSYLSELKSETGKTHAASLKTFSRSRKKLIEILESDRSEADLRAILLKLA
ncbi:hypothetical protein ACFPOB_18370 [Bosea eneae]|uniref:Uncharacterized protein n=1 Tax=Bosea eneae TaxID=151454 RepID=A0ABW0ITB2_9HYPH